MIVLGLLALACYIALSLMSALRMYRVHGHYSHIEFGNKWRDYGHWAPKRFRILRTMQYVALAGIALIILGILVR